MSEFKITTYQDGNTARNMYTAIPVPEEFFEEEKEQKAERKRLAEQRKIVVQKARAKAARSKRILLIGICAGVAAIVGISAIHLVSRGAVASASAQATKLQNELTELTRKNELLEAEINSSIDYKLIEDTAKNDYGMIKPEDGQIITYNTENEGYIKQFRDMQ